MLVEPTSKSFQRTDNHQFVCQYKNPEYYLPRCFPTIYPHGRGCPSDSNCNVISMANYVKHMLCLGGGPDARRFQQNAKFIFTMYTMEMRRKIGGVAFLAQRKDYDEESMDDAPSIKDINELLSYLESSSYGTEDSNDKVEATVKSTADSPVDSENYQRVAEMEKLIKRLIPYSKSLQGSTSQIAYERGKLMAMIPSPIICNHGSWRLFFTTAPSDLYDSRFYDVVNSPINESSVESWGSRHIKVSSQLITYSLFYMISFFFLQTRSLVAADRLSLLRKHPATMARLYDAKQNCLWQHILLGKARPFGLITDYWRRVEVRFLQL